MGKVINWKLLNKSKFYITKKLFVTAFLQTGLTQRQWPEGRQQWGFRGGDGREQAEARTLLVYAIIDPLTAIWV